MTVRRYARKGCCIEFSFPCQVTRTDCSRGHSIQSRDRVPDLRLAAGLHH